MSKTSDNSDLPTKYELTKLEESQGNHLLVPTSTATPECKVYKRRWAILFAFTLFGTISSCSWIQYAIIANVIMRYYNVSSYAVDWTSIIFMLVYIPLIFPASYLVDKKVKYSTRLNSALILSKLTLSLTFCSTFCI